MTNLMDSIERDIVSNMEALQVLYEKRRVVVKHLPWLGKIEIDGTIYANYATYRGVEVQFYPNSYGSSPGLCCKLLGEMPEDTLVEKTKSGSSMLSVFDFETEDGKRVSVRVYRPLPKDRNCHKVRVTTAPSTHVIEVCGDDVDLEKLMEDGRYASAELVEETGGD